MGSYFFIEVTRGTKSNEYNPEEEKRWRREQKMVGFCRGGKWGEDQVYFNFLRLYPKTACNNIFSYHNPRAICQKMKWVDQWEGNERKSLWGCPDLSLLMLFLHFANTRWISQQSRCQSRFPSDTHGDRYSIRELGGFESEIFLSILFYVFKPSNTHLKHPRWSELCKVPQRNIYEAAILVQVRDFRDNITEISEIVCWKYAHVTYYEGRLRGWKDKWLLKHMKEHNDVEERLNKHFGKIGILFS